MLADVAIQRMANLAIVVDDLDAAVTFFGELGMKLEGRGPVEGVWADRTVGLDGMRSEIAMSRIPDGHGKLELTRYHAPAAAGAGSRTAAQHAGPAPRHVRRGRHR
jgi:catechol 2,3-dioxygenase-like lactoylglutathione lyase family enzyme